MKTARLFLLASIAATASAGFNVRSADAADYTPIYEIPQLVEPYGLYAGLFAGWASGDSIVAAVDPEVSGFFGGALLGWELRRDSYIVGVEGDFAYAAIDGTNSAASTSMDVGWLASLRLRGGVNLDGYTVYATGGVAFANVEAGISTATPATDTAMLTGAAVGAGIEVPLAYNVSGRLEYMYYTFNNSDFTIGTTPVQADLRLHTVRGAVVYDFGL